MLKIQLRDFLKNFSYWISIKFIGKYLMAQLKTAEYRYNSIYLTSAANSESRQTGWASFAIPMLCLCF